MSQEIIPLQPNHPEKQRNNEADIEEERRVIEALRAKLSEISLTALQLERYDKTPLDIKDILQDICAAQNALLDERLAGINPNSKPRSQKDGSVWGYREEAVEQLTVAIERIRRRGDMQTIEGKQGDG